MSRQNIIYASKNFTKILAVVGSAVTIFLLSAIPSSAQISLSPDKIFPADKVDVFRTKTFDDAITRQNSCSVTLVDFFFPEIKDGSYIVKVSILFQSITGTTVNPVSEIQMLTDEAVQITKDSPVSIKDRKIGANIPLSQVNNIRIEIRLVKVKSDYQDSLKIIKPILGESLVSNSLFQVADNILGSITDPTAKENQLLFQSDFNVPLNVFESIKIAESNKQLQISNNQLYGIILSGNAKIPDESLKGKLSNGINSVTKFIFGKSTINTGDKIQYSGMARIYFTKDNNPVLPKSLQSALSAFQDKLQNPIVKGNSDSTNDDFGSFVDKIILLTDAFYDNNQIDANTKFSIKEYVKLGNLYYKYRKSKEDSILDEFIDWSNFFDTQGAAVGAQAIGVSKIYSGEDNIAKIYIPYNLPDDSIMQFYLWQVSMHRSLKNKMRTELSIRKPT